MHAWPAECVCVNLYSASDYFFRAQVATNQTESWEEF